MTLKGNQQSLHSVKPDRYPSERVHAVSSGGWVRIQGREGKGGAGKGVTVVSRGGGGEGG